MVDWRRRYGLRSEVEGSIEEFVDGHRGRRCRYRGLAKTHVQHALTALAIHVERLSLREPADGPYRPRPLTAFQQYLDKRGLPRPLWWRQGNGPNLKIPDGVTDRLQPEVGMSSRR
ncbi:transposase [Streptomyces adustus]|uniref:transposase n=1 Tax=Streptomyces adustus TaxID=1609272 RepID=UPI0035DA9B5D